MADAAELALVVKALACGVGGCVEWSSDKFIRRVRNDPELLGLTPEGIQRELIAFVAAGGTVKQIEEQRPKYSGLYQYYYKVILPIAGFPKGVFVELVLSDEDPDVPVVSLVNAHTQL